MNQVSYALGMSIGHQLQQMNATELNIEDFAKGIKDVFAGKTEMTEAEAQAAVQNFFQQKARPMQQRLTAKLSWPRTERKMVW